MRVCITYCNMKELCVSPPRAYTSNSCLYHKHTVLLHYIYQFILVMEMDGVLFEVGTQFVRIVYFRPHLQRLITYLINSTNRINENLDCNTHISLILNLVHPFTNTQIWFQTWTYTRQASPENYDLSAKQSLAKLSFCQ